MPNLPLRLSICLSAALLAACAAPREPRSGDGPGLRQRVEAEFKKADKNGDEWLSREELAAGLPDLAGKFDDIDLDHNGRVNFAELWSYVEWRRVANAPPPQGGARRR